jgi:hypothetical protein
MDVDGGAAAAGDCEAAPYDRSALNGSRWVGGRRSCLPAFTVRDIRLNVTAWRWEALGARTLRSRPSSAPRGAAPWKRVGGARLLPTRISHRYCRSAKLLGQSR